jgi:hypothetical protein
MTYVIRPGHDDEQSSEWRASVVKGSASVPFVFPPTSMKKFGSDALLMDGGTTWNNNMIVAINECMATEGITEQNQISVDVITLMPYELPDFHGDHYHAEQQTYYNKKHEEGA